MYIYNYIYNYILYRFSPGAVETNHKDGNALKGIKVSPLTNTESRHRNGMGPKKTADICST